MKIIHIPYKIAAENRKSRAVVIPTAQLEPWQFLDQYVELCWCRKGQHSVIGEALVTDQWIGKFLNIPARWIRNVELKTGRSYDGLLKHMCSTYDKFTEETEVIITVYQRTE